MKPLQIDEQKARQLYSSAVPEFKSMLEDSFGKDFFSVKITDRVKSISDILSIAGKTLSQITNSNDTLDEAAYKVLKLGISVLNEDWKPDYANDNQAQYEPIFTYKKGFGLVYYGYDGWGSNTRVGPRLCYRSREIMLHGVEILKEYYTQYFGY